MTDARDEVRARMLEMATFEDDRWLEAVPARFRGARLADIEHDGTRATLRQWAASEMPTNLVILGPTGVGKTHAAVAAAYARWHLWRETLDFEPVPEFMDDLRPDSGALSPMSRAKDADVLLLDDLAVERQTDWTRERLDVLINHRWNARRPTVVTSNATRRAIEAAVSDRVWSRLGDGSVVVSMTGPDRRQP